MFEDDAEFRAGLELLLKREAFDVKHAASLREARAALEQSPVDVLLVDLVLPDGDGLELAVDPELRRDADLIVITGNASVDSAVEVLQSGALDYLSKPLDRGRLKSALSNVTRTRALRREVSSLRGELRALGRFGKLVGRSEAMAEVYDQIARVAPTDASVLITGESGTGKEIVAESIHELSPRKGKTLLPVNCGAIPENLIESELFGHVRGAFTGANRQHEGVFERASGGTLFLDEITEMPPELQVNLLRVLETDQVVRVGGVEPIEVDVRVLAATNRPPQQAIEEGHLRSDLFYRLAVFPIELPPLRERHGDVELLAELFLDQLNRESGESKRWAGGALEKLAGMPWEGNVRELKNAVHRAFILADRELQPEEVTGGAPGGVGPAPGHVEIRVGSTIAEAEKQLILATLEWTGGDKQAAADRLGISLKTLYNRLKVYEAAAGS